MKSKQITKITVDIAMTLVFLPISGGSSWARILHMISAYWGFVFLSLHLGLHWNIMIGMTKRVLKPSLIRTWIVRAAGLAVAGYGIYAFIRREIGSYMFLRVHFVFFDFEEPLLFFLIDYIAAMGLFVFIGHYLSEILRAK